MSEAQTPKGPDTPEAIEPQNKIESKPTESIASMSDETKISDNQPQMSGAENPQREDLNQPSPLASSFGGERAEYTQDRQKIFFIGDAGGLRFDSTKESYPEQIKAASDRTQLEPEQISQTQSVEASTTSQTAQAPGESELDILELVALSEALQKQNNDLLDHVEELEKLLDECHKALDLQIKRSQTTEAKLAEQTRELGATQEQLTRLFRELEASHQVAQRQQILIETLNHQLQSSQERVAQLERQCAFIQQRYNEQTQLLLQTETARQELQDRLQRQQRYTLQFKAALDKCLEMPALREISSDISSAITAVEAQNYSQNVSEALQLLLKPQPIQPWTAPLELPPTEQINSEENTGRGIILPQFSPRVEQQVETETEPFAANPFLQVASSEFKLESDLPPESAISSTADFSEAEDALWQELERLTQDTSFTVNPTSSENTVISDSSNLEKLVDADDEWVEKSEDTPQQEEELVSATPASSSSIVPATGDESSSAKPYPNWPSPVVYPQRPPKKIKSLASVDLPSFPRISKDK